MNVYEDLKKIAESNAQDIIDEANQILAQQDAKDQSMLKYFGTGSIQNEIKEKHAKASDLLKEGYVTQEDIKSVCIKYNLRFLKASLYKKPIPQKVLNDLRKYTEEHNLGDYNLRSNLYIIAPISHFHSVKKEDKDPLLMYVKERTNAGDISKVELVSSWGNDFTALRLIGAWFVKHFKLIFYMLGCSIIFGGMTYVIGFGDVLKTIGTLFLSFLCSVIFIGVMSENDGGLPDSIDKWNTNVR